MAVEPPQGTEDESIKVSLAAVAAEVQPTPSPPAKPRTRPEITDTITVEDGTVFELRKPNNKSPDKSVYYCALTNKTMQMKSIIGHSRTKVYLAALNAKQSS